MAIRCRVQRLKVVSGVANYLYLWLHNVSMLETEVIGCGGPASTGVAVEHFNAQWPVPSWLRK